MRKLHPVQRSLTAVCQNIEDTARIDAHIADAAEPMLQQALLAQDAVLGKRELHDHLAGTRVLQVEGESYLPAWARVWLGLQLVFAVAWTAWFALAMQGALRLAVENAL